MCPSNIEQRIVCEGSWIAKNYFITTYNIYLMIKSSKGLDPPLHLILLVIISATMWIDIYFIPQEKIRLIITNTEWKAIKIRGCIKRCTLKYNIIFQFNPVNPPIIQLEFFFYHLYFVTQNFDLNYLTCQLAFTIINSNLILLDHFFIFVYCFFTFIKFAILLS